MVSFWRRAELSDTSGTPIDRFPPARELIQVWCDCSPKIAFDRFFARERHPAHGDRVATLNRLRRLAELGPLDIGRLVRINTTDGLDGDAIMHRLA